MASVASVLATQIRRALTTLHNSHGVIKAWRAKGKERVTIVRGPGEQLEIALRAAA